ncbi:MAG TPA: L,D-transpeptidase [Vicinamibacterales bacterium]|nr:L,D-transpeptidase [Vicinamibacterales bacterium]
MAAPLAPVVRNTREDNMETTGTDRIAALKGSATVTTAVLIAMLAADRAFAADSTTTTTATTTTTPSRRLVVSIPDRQLALIENDAVVTVFPVAVGAAATPSPVGTFTIVNRVSNPTYYKSGKAIAPGARNPVGTRWIGLSRKGYGIHGTNNPRSIGAAKSHGCIRLRNQDVEQLFDRVRPGDVVELHAERTSEISRLFDESLPTAPQPEAR